MYIRNQGHMTKMAAMPIYGPFKNLLLQNRWTDFNETWHEASMAQALQCICVNHDPVMTLTYFTARSTYVTNAFEWGKLLKCHLKLKSCRKWAVGQ